MIKLQQMAAALALAVALCAGFYSAGIIHQKSIHAQQELKARAELFRRGEIISRDLAQKDAEIATLQSQLEGEALVDRDAARPAFGLASVRRLNRAGTP